MRNKYFILVFTFLCLMVSQSSYSQDWDWEDMGWGDDINDFMRDYENQGGHIDYYNNAQDYANDVNNDNDYSNDWEYYEYVNPDFVGDTRIDSQGNIWDYDYTRGWRPVDNSGNGNTDIYNGLLDPYGYNPNYDRPDDDQYPNKDQNPSGDSSSTDGTSSSGSTCKGCTNMAVFVDEILPQSMAYGYIDTNNMVRIRTDDGTFKFPSQLDPNNLSHQRAMNGFAASLAHNLNGLDKNIVIISAKSKTDLSIDSQASTNGSTIKLNSNGGYSNFYDNANNFKSIVKHEIFHVEDNREPKFKPDLATHANVYVKAANDPTYKNTTQEFRKQNTGSFANYLLNMDKSPNPSFNRDVIAAKIAAFNKNGTDVTIKIVNHYMQKGSLQLQVQFGTETSGNIIKTTINE